MSKFKGELKLENGMVMVLDFNAFANYEEITGKNIQDLTKKLDSGKATMAEIRYLYQAMLMRHQPNLTIYDAGDVLSDYPEAWVEAFHLANARPEAAVGNDQPKGKVKKA